MLDPTAYAKCLLCALLEQACVDYKSFARRGILVGDRLNVPKLAELRRKHTNRGEFRVYGPSGWYTVADLQELLDFFRGAFFEKLCIDYTAGLSPNKVRRALGFDTRPPNQIEPDPHQRHVAPWEPAPQAAQVEDAP